MTCPGNRRGERGFREGSWPWAYAVRVVRQPGRWEKAKPSRDCPTKDGVFFKLLVISCPKRSFRNRNQILGFTGLGEVGMGRDSQGHQSRSSLGHILTLWPMHTTPSAEGTLTRSARERESLVVPRSLSGAHLRPLARLHPSLPPLPFFPLQ